MDRAVTFAETVVLESRGRHDGAVYHAGETYVLRADQAARWVRRGKATFAESAAVQSAADAEPVERVADDPRAEDPLTDDPPSDGTHAPSPTADAPPGDAAQD